LARIWRYSPPKRSEWLPRIQAKLSESWRTGVLRPWGKLPWVMVGSVTVPTVSW